MAQLAPMMQLRAHFEDKCGHPLAGGSVFAFEAGTSTPKDTFKDANGTIPNTHPIKLDYRGEADIFLLTGRYRFVVYSSSGTKIYDVDDVGEWLGNVLADNVIDGDKSQHQINEEQKVTNASLDEAIIAEETRASEAEAILQININTEATRAGAAEIALDTKINTETARATAAEAALDTKINANGVGNRAYKTYAEMDADKANIPAKSKVTVTNDPDSTKDGDYQWDGTVFTKSSYDPIAQAAADATAKANAAEQNAITFAADRTKNLSSTIEEVLFVKTDVNDQVIEFTDINGDLHLTNLDKSVQKSFAELEGAKSVTTVNRTTVTHIFADYIENVLAYLKSDGDLVLIGVEGSVQAEFKRLNLSDEQIREKTKSLDAFNNLSDVTHVFADNNENIVAYIKTSGGLYLVGLDGSVQSNLTLLASRATALEQNLQKLRDEVAVDEILIQKDLVPQNYSIDAVQALSIKCDYPTNIQGFFPDSPYRLNDSPTHPCVIELARPLRGYKYLMVQTPYYENNPLEENPCIYGSNDLSTWTMFKDMPQPLDEPPTWDEALEGKKGYLSDPWWTYDHINKELYCCYRKAYTVGPNQYNPTDIMQLLYRKTSNGIHWSKPQKLFGDIENGVDPIISPAIIYDFKNKVWCMFYFKSVRSFAMRTNPDFRNPNTWSAPIDLGYESWIAANNPPQLGWHLDVRYIGDRLFAMINDSTNAKLYLAYADKDDFTKWTFTSSSVLNTPPPRNSCYKGSMIAVPVDSTQMKLHVVWTDAGGYRRLYNAKTFPISIV